MSNIKAPGWIKVTSTEDNSCFYINSKLITHIIRSTLNSSLISYTKDHSDTVKESPEDVIRLINESYND